MPDLKMTAEQVLIELGAAHAAALTAIDRRAAELKADVKTIAAVLADTSKINLGADVALTTEFASSNVFAAGAQLQLSIWGYPLGSAQLANDLPRGRYRVVVLLNRVGA